MTYKTKSLLYFLCFLAASTGYYLIEQHQDFSTQLQSSEVAETHFEDDFELEETSDKEIENRQ